MTWYESGNLASFALCSSLSKTTTFFQRVTVARGGKIDRVRVYVCAASDDIRLAVYDDDSGPNNLLGQSDDYSTSGTGYVTLWLTNTTEPIAAGSYVWVAVQVNGAAANPTDLYTDNGSPPEGGRLWTEAGGWAGGFPDPASAAEFPNDLSLYVGASVVYVEPVTLSDLKVEISTDGGTTWQNISGFSTRIDERRGDRLVGKRWTADGNRPIILPGKEDAREITITVVYTEETNEPYEVLRAAMESGDNVQVRWMPKGSSSGNSRFTTDANYGIITKRPLPTGEVEGGIPIVCKFGITTAGVDKDTV